jgi:hypothetical protein
MTLLLLLLFLLAGMVNFVYTLIILRELAGDKQGLTFFDLRIYVLRNLKTYRAITRSKYGRVGSAYYGYLTTLALMILCAILALGSLAGGG